MTNTTRRPGLADAAPPDRPPVTDQVRHARLTGAWAGLLWLGAGIGAFTPETPGAGASADEVRAYVEANLGTLTVNAVSSVVAAVAVLALTAALASLVRAHRPHGVAGGFVLGAGVLAAAQMIFFSAVYSVWLFVDPIELGDPDLTALYAVGAVADAFGSLVLFVTCAMVGVVSCLALRDRFLSRPMAVLGLLVAAAQMVSVGRLLGVEGAFTVAMYVGIFGWFLWPAAVGVDLAIRSLRRR